MAHSQGGPWAELIRPRRGRIRLRYERDWNNVGSCGDGWTSAIASVHAFPYWGHNRRRTFRRAEWEVMPDKRRLTRVAGRTQKWPGGMLPTIAFTAKQRERGRQVVLRTEGDKLGGRNLFRWGCKRGPERRGAEIRLPAAEARLRPLGGMVPVMNLIVVNFGEQDG